MAGASLNRVRKPSPSVSRQFIPGIVAHDLGINYDLLKDVIDTPLVQERDRFGQDCIPKRKLRPDGLMVADVISWNSSQWDFAAWYPELQLSRFDGGRVFQQ